MISEIAHIPGLTRNWGFQASSVFRWQRRANAELLLRTMHRSPAWCTIKPLTPKPAWVAYFLFLPDEKLSAAHRFTLSRLRDLGFAVLVVCAAPEPGCVPQELHGFCDALLWKGLAGYDFSAYTLALWQISRRSPHADVFVLNDSVLGPFTDVRPAFRAAPWNLTGFTGAREIANHIQSYAFFMRDVDKIRMMRLAPVFFPFVSISDRDAVIQLQELRMARIAARHMTVGALWFPSSATMGNPTITQPLALIDAGFPFLKRMLLTKPTSFTQCPVPKDALLSRLEQLGHPIDAGMNHA